MTILTTEPRFFKELEQQPDEALREVAARATEILAARAEHRKKQALDEIRRIAKQHGLDVAVRKPAARRGRPPKKPAST